MQKAFPGELIVLNVVLILTFFLLIFAGAGRCQAQTWITNSPMLTSRWGHTATELTNGDLLITGGRVYNQYNPVIILEVTNDAEIYDPNTGIPTLTGFMNDDRAFNQAVRLTNGQVLVMGGAGDSTSETYDPGSASWINWVNMNEERQDFVSVLLTNGTVLAASGFDENNLYDTNTAEVYDPGSATWTIVGHMPYGADTFAAVLLTNGTVLVCGGTSNGTVVANAAIYYPKSQTWTNTGFLQEPRSGHGASLLPNGQVLVEGGAGDQTTEIYDPGSATWSYGATMNDGRYNCYAVTLTNGEVLVSGNDTTDVEIYDPVQKIWSLTASLPFAGYNQTETAESNGQVVVTGGDTTEYNGPGLNIVETFSLTSLSGGVPNLDVTNSPTSGLVPLAVNFTSPSTDSQGNTVTNWNWNFGDGNFSTAQNPTHTYSSIGTYTPTLTAYSTYGTTPLNIEGLYGVTVTNAAVTVSVVPFSGAAPLTVQFTSPGVDSLGNTITNWNWNFGDAANSRAQSPEHIYATTGNFAPSLVAMSTHSSSPLTVYGLGLVTVTNSSNPFFHVLYSMPTNSGPNGGLALANGVLYGTTIYGGAVFAVNTNGLGFTNLYVGLGRPEGGPALSGATLYGSSYFGGSNGFGEIFAINTNGTGYTDLYSFSSNPDGVGQEPAAGLSVAGGALFGTTQYGGGVDDGVVFAVSTNGTGFSDQYAFSADNNDYRING
ncbi:MAG TPA: PKD domain-containing protein, partial [Candidatus Acidoferrales bacterium]|nr:PKD domain-containing protein [Candidatus Acidoferrales bacterium]